MDEQTIKAQVEALVDYIMKNCLWQFNSRAWDRRKQNAGVIGKASLMLRGEPVENETSMDRCYWVDAVCLVDEYKARFPWLITLEKDEIKTVMEALHARMDWLTIDGSLNEELTIQHY